MTTDIEASNVHLLRLAFVGEQQSRGLGGWCAPHITRPKSRCGPDWALDLGKNLLPGSFRFWQKIVPMIVELRCRILLILSPTPPQVELEKVLCALRAQVITSGLGG